MRRLLFVIALAAALSAAGGRATFADDSKSEDEKDKKPIKLLAVPRKFIGMLPRSWSGPILDTQTSFEKFLRWSFSGGDTLDAPPVPAAAAEKSEDDPEPTLASDFFYKPIQGGTSLVSVNHDRFRGYLILGRDFRAGTLNATFGERPDLWSTDPTVTQFAVDSPNFSVESFYETYQMIPQAVYIRVEF